MRKTRKFLSLMMAVVMLCSCFVVGNVQGASFTPRLTEPSTTSSYWIHTSYGGLNSCIIASGNSVLPNCVGYAWGRAYEILNRQPDLSRGNAGDWFAYNKNKYDNGNGGYPYSTDITKPKLGAIVCWSQPGQAGHVAVVEKINGNQITTSESGWNSRRFWTTNRSTTNSTLNQSGYVFQGYIYILGDSVTPHTCNKGTYMYYWANHPHYNCYKCSICGEIWASEEMREISLCSICTNIIYPSSGATFKIASAVGNNMYLDFAVSSNNVQIYEDCDGSTDPSWVKSQYFVLTHVGDGWYTIKNVGNNQMVDVADANPASGTNIGQCPANGSNAQLFKFQDAGDGYCYIKSKLGTYVDVAGGVNANNTNVQAYEFNGAKAQKWKLIQKEVPTVDTEKPSISNVRITDVNETGFTISCEVYDNVGIKEVLFPVWTTEALGPSLGVEAGQDDIVYHKATMNGNTATCRINISDHNNSYGEYVCDPHIYDTSDNLLIGGRLYIQVAKSQTLYFDVNHNNINVNLFRTINGKIIDGVEFDTNTQILSFDGSFSSWTTVMDIPFNVSENDWICFTANSISGTVQEGDCVVFEALDKDFNTMSYSIGRRIHYDVAHAGNGVYNGAWGIDKDACGIKYIKLFPWSGDGPFYCDDLKLQIKIEKGSTTEYSPAAQVMYKGSSYGTLPTPTRTGYTFDGWYTSATGGTKITSSSVVNVSGDQTLYAHWTCNHSSTEVRNAKTATCTEVGFTGDTYCNTCSTKIKAGSETAKLTHTDTNSDYKCDYGCGYEFDNAVENCSCSCHKSGISKLFFNIILFFQKLFGTNQECKCGVAHY